MKYLYLPIIAIASALTSCSDKKTNNEHNNVQIGDSLEKSNIELIRGFYGYLDKHDSTSIEQMVDKGCMMYFGSYEQPMSFSEVKPMIKEVYSGFPDYHSEIEIIFASGEYVTCKVKYAGTHTGVYMGLSPTGKNIGYKGMFIFKIKDGRIVEMHGMEDDLVSLIKGEP